MAIRARRDEDLPAIARQIEASHRLDRYPPHWPDGVPTERFLTSRHELAALVLERSGRVVGHVALHHAGAPSVMAVAAGTLAAAETSLAVVARLFVTPEARRAGTATELLHEIMAVADGLGRRPVLDVWAELHGAIALYEREGWELAGSTSIDLASGCSPRCAHAGRSLSAHVYIGPHGPGSENT